MSRKIVVLADENIAAAADAFGQFGEVRLVAGRSIDRAMLAEVDALVVRSITTVDRQLLDGTPVRFVGTATIGRDHLDEEYLWKSGIRVVDAAGGGARSVAEYAITALLLLQSRGLLTIRKERIGVVGVGAIGQKVVDFLELLGATVVAYDPPRAEEEEEFESCRFDDLHACRAIVLAVPLTRDGEHPTHHMIDAEFLESLPPGASIINVARGGVVSSAALAPMLAEGRLHAVLDVWEEEPEIDPALLGPTEIATPHVAGYSRDGKLRGTSMMTQGLAEHFGTEDRWDPESSLGEAGRIEIGRDLDPDEALLKACLTACPLTGDDRALRTTFPLSRKERARGFDFLRKNYPVRREFSAWRVVGGDRRLEGLGFRLADNSR